MSRSIIPIRPNLRSMSMYSDNASLLYHSTHTKYSSRLLACSIYRAKSRLDYILNREEYMLDTYSYQITYMRTIPTLDEISRHDFVDETTYNGDIRFDLYKFVRPPYELKFRRDVYVDGYEPDDPDDYKIEYPGID